MMPTLLEQNFFLDTQSSGYIKLNVSIKIPSNNVYDHIACNFMPTLLVEQKAEFEPYFIDMHTSRKGKEPSY